MQAFADTQLNETSHQQKVQEIGNFLKRANLICSAKNAGMAFTASDTCLKSPFSVRCSHVHAVWWSKFYWESAIFSFLSYYMVCIKLANIALLSIRGISRGHFRSLSALICGNFQDNVGNLKEFLGCQRDWHFRHLLQFSTWKFLAYWFVEFQETCVLTFHPLINELINFDPISIYLNISISNFHQLPMLVLRIIAMAFQWQHIQDYFLSCAWWQ